MLDKHTLAKAERWPESKRNSRRFIVIRDPLEELHVESLSTQLYSTIAGRGEAMGVGAVAEKSAWPDQAMAEEERCTAEE